MPSRIAVDTRSQEGRFEGIGWSRPSSRTRNARGKRRVSNAVVNVGEDLNLFTKNHHDHMRNDCMVDASRTSINNCQ